MQLLEAQLSALAEGLAEACTRQQAHEQQLLAAAARAAVNTCDACCGADDAPPPSQPRDAGVQAAPLACDAGVQAASLPPELRHAAVQATADVADDSAPARQHAATQCGGGAAAALVDCAAQTDAAADAQGKAAPSPEEADTARSDQQPRPPTLNEGASAEAAPSPHQAEEKEKEEEQRRVLAALAQRIQEAERQAAERAAQLAGLEHALPRARQRASAAEAQAAQLEGELRDLLARLRDGQEELGRVEGRLEAVRGEEAALSESCRQLVGFSEGLRRELHAELAGLAGGVREAAEQSMAYRAALEGECERLRDQRVGLVAEAVEAKQELRGALRMLGAAAGARAAVEALGCAAAAAAAAGGGEAAAMTQAAARAARDAQRAVEGLAARQAEADAALAASVRAHLQPQALAPPPPACSRAAQTDGGGDDGCAGGAAAAEREEEGSSGVGAAALGAGQVVEAMRLLHSLVCACGDVRGAVQLALHQRAAAAEALAGTFHCVKRAYVHCAAQIRLLQQQQEEDEVVKRGGAAGATPSQQQQQQAVVRRGEEAWAAISAQLLRLLKHAAQAAQRAGVPKHALNHPPQASASPATLGQGLTLPSSASTAAGGSGGSPSCSSWSPSGQLPASGGGRGAGSDVDEHLAYLSHLAVQLQRTLHEGSQRQQEGTAVLLQACAAAAAPGPAPLPPPRPPAAAPAVSSTPAAPPPAPAAQAQQQRAATPALAPLGQEEASRSVSGGAPATVPRQVSQAQVDEALRTLGLLHKPGLRIVLDGAAGAAAQDVTAQPAVTASAAPKPAASVAQQAAWRAAEPQFFTPTVHTAGGRAAGVAAASWGLGGAASSSSSGGGASSISLLQRVRQMRESLQGVEAG